MPLTATTPDHVLHIGRAPLPRVQLEGLRIVGVEVSHLAPADLQSSLDDPAPAPAMAQRLRDAVVCVIDEGTGTRLGAVVCAIRQAGRQPTYSTLQCVAEAARGTVHGRRLAGEVVGGCEFISRDNLFHALRDLGTAVRTAPITIAAPVGLVTRPPLPLRYLRDPDAYTESELRSDFGVRRGGFWPLRDLPQLRTFIANGAAALLGEANPVEVLARLIQHLPSDDLSALQGDEAARWWARIVDLVENEEAPEGDEIADPVDWRAGTELLLLRAIVRDSGRVTLSRMPEALCTLREEVERGWEAKVAALASEMSCHLVAPRGRALEEAPDETILRAWGVISCEDPLAPDVNAHLFQPTLETFRVARRYRSAPEVILLARERWGGRPYLSRRTRGHLTYFVGESFPTSAIELEGWIRLLQVLPDGRMRKSILQGIVLQWPRIEVEVLEVCRLHECVSVPSERIPCFSRDGRLRHDLFDRITDPRLKMNVRARAVRMDVARA